MKARQTGFTLIELMFTVILMAVLLGLGIPNFRDFIRNSRMTSQANDLLTGITLARSEAIKRRAPVTLCSGASPTCDSGDFTTGWFVFVDDNGNGARNDPEEILREHAAMPDPLTVTVKETGDAETEADPTYDDSSYSYFSFGQSGFRRMGDGTLPEATALVICDARGNVATHGGPDVSASRAVEVSATGRAVVTRSLTRIEDVLGGCP
ncbi:MAG: GspH/FimT family pseudopilin [Steroidobacteraceae bacterium]|nr:GspH/FimT family pseudopilin [Steroidobacteraceae bacterium]